jgi:hypothetical protein
MSYRIRSNSSALVIPEVACGYPGSWQALVLATIPDNAFGISRMTPLG